MTVMEEERPPSRRAGRDSLNSASAWGTCHNVVLCTDKAAYVIKRERRTWYIPTQQPTRTLVDPYRVGLPPPDLSGYRHTYPPPPSIAALTFPMDKTPKRQERVRPPTYSSLGRGKQEGRQRLSIELGPEAIDNIERLRQMHGEITNTQVIKLALAGHPAVQTWTNGQAPSRSGRNA